VRERASARRADCGLVMAHLLALAILALSSVAPDRAYELGGYFDRAATAYAIDPVLLVALSYHESCFQKSARSTAGAIGVMQLLPKYFGRQATEEQHILRGAGVLKLYEQKCRTTLRALGAYRSGRCQAGPRARATLRQARIIRAWMAAPQSRLRAVRLP
jgi:soluble lytic murein transglycosylase-like protein